MKNCTCRYALLLLAVLAGLTNTEQAPAAEPDCTGSAAAWISELGSKNSDILQSHARAKCEFSAKWMRENQVRADSNSWKQMCTDLVLIWTYQECVYFRDDVEREAYTPCQVWTRRMYEQCIANNISWFASTASQ